MFWRLLFAASLILSSVPARAELRVGAAITDVSPPQFPVLVNGGMLTRSADKLVTPVSARAIVIDDGEQRIAMVVVDSCMMPRQLLDDAKRLAAKRTKIRAEQMMISATHTHTAPSCVDALGTDADPAYVSYLREKLAESIAAAEAKLQPASVGFAVGDAAPFTALRRWVRRSDRVGEDPFGNLTVRANMHAANNWDDVTGPSGPEDPELSLIAFRSPSGQPIALLANFSMHYFGDQAVSADYFGLFCNRMQERLAKGQADAAPVAIMSHGCSGDIWLRDYAVPPEQRAEFSIEGYTDSLVQIAMDAYATVEYQPDATIAMAEQRLPLKYRVPDQQRLQWAQKIDDAVGDQPPRDTTEVYAREQVRLHQLQETEVVVQALRIGEIGIATTPNETYALTGLKLKFQSPLKHTMVIELANGGDGYIPPPEQHVLGGYNTWAARSAGLEVMAEPKITAAALGLLEKVSGMPRKRHEIPFDPGTKQLHSLGPLAHYRMSEWSGPRAIDASSNHHDGVYEPGVVFFLEGPPLQNGASTPSDSTSVPTANIRDLNRAAHFAGGRLRTRFEDLGDSYSVAMWVWNGMPNEARSTTGWLFSRDHEDSTSPGGDHLGIGGTATEPGCLIYQHGNDSETVHVGNTPLQRWTWNRVTFVRDGQTVRIYLNDEKQPEITAEIEDEGPRSSHIFFGGRSDNEANFEGRLDEIVVFDKVVDGP